MPDYREFLGEVLISEEQLKERIAELGAVISRDYHDPVVIVGASEMYEARCRTHHEVPRGK